MARIFIVTLFLDYDSKNNIVAQGEILGKYCEGNIVLIGFHNGYQ